MVGKKGGEWEGELVGSWHTIGGRKVEHVIVSRSIKYNNISLNVRN